MSVEKRAQFNTVVKKKKKKRKLAALKVLAVKVQCTAATTECLALFTEYLAATTKKQLVLYKTVVSYTTVFARLLLIHLEY